MHRVCLALAGIAALLLAMPLPARAHAQLDHAQPAVGGKVASAPKEVVIWYTEALEAKFSSIVVTDAKGATVNMGAAMLDPNNTAELHVALKPLTPGPYKVFWRVLSVDTHRTQGSFSFTVGP
jgi:methionine-rich copper-binding protein CopC